jgi:hypothetical protein
LQICELHAETEEDALRFLTETRIMHSELRSVVASVDKNFARILPLATMFCIFEAIFALFACLSVFLHIQTGDEDDFKRVTFNLLWFTLIFGNSTLMIWQCEQVYNEVKFGPKSLQKSYQSICQMARTKDCLLQLELKNCSSAVKEEVHRKSHKNSHFHLLFFKRV